MNRAKRAEAIADLYLREVLQHKEEVSVLALRRSSSTIWLVFTEILSGGRVALQQAGRKALGRFRRRDSGAPPDVRRQSFALNATEFEPVPYPMEASFRFQAAHGNAQRKWIIDPGGLLPTAVVEPIQETNPSLTSLAAYAGDYSSDDLRVTYRLTVKEGRLWMSDLIGLDGITRPGNLPFSEFRLLLNETFDLKGAPIVIAFKRDQTGIVNGFSLNGFHERGIPFVRRSAR